MKRAWALALIPLAAACGSSAASSGSSTGGARSVPAVTDAAQVATLAHKAGLGCDDYTPKAPSNNPARSRGTCTLAGDDGVILSVFRDGGETDNAMGMAERTGCAFAKGFGIRHFYVVRGPNWTIAVKSETGLHQAASALHAEAKTIDC